MLFVDDHVASSNNSINDNIANSAAVAAKKSQRTCAAHQLKKLLKPIFTLLKKRLHHKKELSYFLDEECRQNSANEELEARIFQDIDCCERFAAVPVFHGEDAQVDLLPVTRGQRYVPVHFARTDAGTFFWTSTTAPDCDLVFHGDENPITNHQTPELQVPSDRWAQA